MSVTMNSTTSRGFARSSAFLAAILAFAAALPIAARAVTANVVWESDFGTTAKTGLDGKTHTLSLPDNAWLQQDGTIQIGSRADAQGATIAVTGGVSGEKLSVLMEYSGATAKSYATPIYVAEGTWFGLMTKASSLDVLGHWWNGNGTVFPKTADPATTTVMPASGYLLFVFPQGTVQAYSATTRGGLTDSSAGGSIAGLSFSGKTLTKIGLGGVFSMEAGKIDELTNQAVTAFDGLVIKRVAIFNSDISASDAASYAFPSEFPSYNTTVSADTTWSAVLSNAGITSENMASAKLFITAENNPKITFGTGDSALYGLAISGAAKISLGDDVYGSDNRSFGKTLLTTSTPLSIPNVSFEVKSGWKGTFVTTPGSINLYAQNAETISINIGGGDDNTTTVQPSPEANLVSGSEYVGLYPTPGSAWNNISGHWTGGSQTVTLTSAKAFDGETTAERNTVQLSGKANNTWAVGADYTSFLRGYLDDTGGVEVKIVGVPYSQYDVIVYATSDSSLQLNYFTINDVSYTCGSDGIATEGTTAWGVGATKTPALGKNAMLVQDITGSTLTISGARAANSGPRVTVCAVQIINKGDIAANAPVWTTTSGFRKSFHTGLL